MQSKQGAKRLLKMLDVVLDFVSFVALRYVLIACKYAFKESAIYVFFFSIDIYIILKYWEALERSFPNKALRMVAIVSAFAAVWTIVYCFGYMDISPILRRW